MSPDSATGADPHCFTPVSHVPKIAQGRQGRGVSEEVGERVQCEELWIVEKSVTQFRSSYGILPVPSEHSPHHVSPLRRGAFCVCLTKLQQPVAKILKLGSG